MRFYALVAVLGCVFAVHAQNLVQNGDFATSDFTDWTVNNGMYNDQTLISVVGAVNDPSVYSARQLITPPAGHSSQSVRS